MKMERRTFAGADGLTLVADAVGDRGAPPALFLHGGGQTRGSWKASLLAVAATGFRAIAYDARGHGDSGWSASGDYRLDAFAADLGHVIAALDAAPVVVGASLGGLTALLHLGEQAPDAARSLVLVDVAPRLRQAGTARILAFMAANPDGFASIDEAAEAVSRYNPERPRPARPDGLARNLRERDGRFYWHWDPAFIAGRSDDPAAFARRLEAAARGVRVPTLLIHAGRSDVIGEEELAHLRDTMPDCRYAKVEKTGHMIAGDDNDAFNAAILNHIVALP